MPRPTSGTTIQRPDLAALAYEFAVQETLQELIADVVMPVFKTPHQSADYPVIPAEAMLKIPHTIDRAPRAPYGRSDWEFKTGTYSTKERGWEEAIDDVEAKLYERFFDAEKAAAMRALNIVLRGREKRVADYLFNATTFSGKTSAATVPWSVAADADIRGDAKTARDAVKAACGLRPNAAIMSMTAFEAITDSLQFLDHVKFTNAILLDDLEVQKKAVARFLGVQEVIIGDSRYDAAKKGQSLNSTQVWNATYCLFAVIAKNPLDLTEPCVGRSFLWTGYSPEMVNVESYREEGTKSDIIRVYQHISESPVFLNSGYLLSAVTA